MSEISVLGVITARGGSKSIPRKNIKELAGKPLIGYTIEAAQSSDLTRVILSTEDEEIAAISRSFGLEVPYMRPVELAADNSTSMEVVQHTLSWLKEHEGVNYDYLMILQPTSPFRTSADINECIRLAVEKNADSVMSMVKLEDFSRKKLKQVTNEGLIKAFISEEGSTSGRRQDAEDVYKRNAAIYLTKTEHIMKGSLFGERSYPYVMPADRSIDINDAFDFELAEFIARKKYE